MADADVTFVVVDLETGKAQAIAGEIKEGFDLRSRQALRTAG